MTFISLYILCSIGGLFSTITTEGLSKDNNLFMVVLAALLSWFLRSSLSNFEIYVDGLSFPEDSIATPLAKLYALTVITASINGATAALAINFLFKLIKENV